MKFNFEVKGVKLAYLHIKNIKVTKEYNNLDDQKKIFGQIKDKFTLDDLSKDKTVKSFRDLYWIFDMDPTKDRVSSEALVRRIIKGENLWKINNVVDSLNLISAKYRLPMGYLDFSTLSGNITVRTTKQDEEFIKIGGKIKKCKGTEICVADEEKIVDYGFATSDSDLTKVTNDTKELLILIYATKDVEDKTLNKVINDSEKILSKVTDFKVISKGIESSNVKTNKKINVSKMKQNKKPSNKDNKKQTLGLTVKKDEDFSEWYTQVIQKSELADYSSVSGCIVYRPYSYEIWERVQDFFNIRIKKSGVKNSYFPVLIPENLLTKEQNHVEGFAPEVAWVTHGGNTKLGERLAVRPTSETIMYDSYSKWIRSHNDLPLRLNQWNSVVRWEFKHATPFLRGREFLWQEGHTVFATKKEADREVLEILEYYKQIHEDLLAIPVVKGKKTTSEKFAGADYSTTCETFLPIDKAIQACTSHHLGQNFSKAFEISFLDSKEKKQFGWQNSWGLSTRTLGVMVITHGDDKGLVLPPYAAPIQAVIIPILFDKTKDVVLKKSKELKKQLSKHRIHLDDRLSHSPGFKFNEWELKGVPIRIELGPRDLENNQVVIARRDTSKKITVKLDKVKETVDNLIDDIHINMLESARSRMIESIVEVKDWKEFLKAVKDKKWILAQHCGNIDCEMKIKDDTNGVKTNCIPFDMQPKKLGKCVKCGEKAEYEVLFAKSY